MLPHAPGTNAWRRVQQPVRAVCDRHETMAARTQVLEGELGGRYWVRTSDLLGVNEALYR